MSLDYIIFLIQASLKLYQNKIHLNPLQPTLIEVNSSGKSGLKLEEIEIFLLEWVEVG